MSGDDNRIAPGAKPGGLGTDITSSSPKAACPASYNPPLSPIRGSSEDARGVGINGGFGRGGLGDGEHRKKGELVRGKR